MIVMYGNTKTDRLNNGDPREGRESYLPVGAGYDVKRGLKAQTSLAATHQVGNICLTLPLTTTGDRVGSSTYIVIVG